MYACVSSADSNTDSCADPVWRVWKGREILREYFRYCGGCSCVFLDSRGFNSGSGSRPGYGFSSGSVIFVCDSEALVVPFELLALRLPHQLALSNGRLLQILFVLLQQEQLAGRLQRHGGMDTPAHRIGTGAVTGLGSLQLALAVELLVGQIRLDVVERDVAGGAVLLQGFAQRWVRHGRGQCRRRRWHIQPHLKGLRFDVAMRCANGWVVVLMYKTQRGHGWLQGLRFDVEAIEKGCVLVYTYKE